MSELHKYFYLKLKADFFEQDKIIILESMDNGVAYSNILLKLYLKALKTDGELMISDGIPYTPSYIASITRQPLDTVKTALKLFKELGIIKQLKSGKMYVSDFQEMAGKSSTEADRKRRYRARIKQAENDAENKVKGDDVIGKKTVQGDDMIVNSGSSKNGRKKREKSNDDGVSDVSSGQTSTRVRVRVRDRVRDRDKKTNVATKIVGDQPAKKVSNKSASQKEIAQEVLRYLNDHTYTDTDQKHNHSYALKGDTLNKIMARVREGYELKDFAKVIDYKQQQWGRSAKMHKFVRPATLFSSKFSEYLEETKTPIRNGNGYYKRQQNGNTEATEAMIFTQN